MNTFVKGTNQASITTRRKMEADRKASAEKDAAARRTSDGRSVVAEVYPALWSHKLARADRTEDQHDAYSIARLAFPRRPGW